MLILRLRRQGRLRSGSQLGSCTVPEGTRESIYIATHTCRCGLSSVVSRGETGATRGGRVVVWGGTAGPSTPAARPPPLRMTTRERRASTAAARPPPLRVTTMEVATHTSWCGLSSVVSRGGSGATLDGRSVAWGGTAGPSTPHAHWSARPPLRMTTEEGNSKPFTSRKIRKLGTDDGSLHNHPNVRHPEGAAGVGPRVEGPAVGHWAARSSHVGLSRSIKAIFLARSHPFNCFSREIAECGEKYLSKYTRR
jgi:hypothetical protein